MQKMWDRVLGDNITLNIEFADHQDPVYADAGQIEQILMNLVINAKDAIGGEGAITIRTVQISLNNPMMQKMVHLEPGDYAIIYVSDTGTGMDEETRSHIFEPFYTTKEEGKGTGLGLSTVYGIVQQHKGAIKVDSIPGKGTTFQIYLPIADEVDHDHPAEEKIVEHNGNASAILVVEDDEMVLRYVYDILTARGYNVLTASDGEEALEVASDAAHIDAVITDIMMPGMNGDELAKEIETRFPGIPVLFMSGHAMGKNIGETTLRAGENFLSKPVKPEELFRLIQANLSGSQEE